MNVIDILDPTLQFLLLPFFSERWVLFLFAVPWLIVSFNPGWWVGYEGKSLAARGYLSPLTLWPYWPWHWC